MASVRQLPSGAWQASVLLERGRRTTSTHPTAEQARSWADETEAVRNELRRTALERQDKPRGAMLLSELEVLVLGDGLTTAQKQALIRLAELVRPV